MEITTQETTLRLSIYSIFLYIIYVIIQYSTRVASMACVLLCLGGVNQSLLYEVSLARSSFILPRRLCCCSSCVWCDMIIILVVASYSTKAEVFDSPLYSSRVAKIPLPWWSRGSLSRSRDIMLDIVLVHNILVDDATQKGPKGTDKSYSDRIEWGTLYHKPVARAKSMP